MGYELILSAVKKDKVKDLKDLNSFIENNNDNVIDFWCSSGRTFLDEFVTGHLDQIEDTECYLVTKDFIKEAMQWADLQLNDYDMKEVDPVESIKFVDGESKLLSKLDGVVVSDLNGTEYDCYKDREELFYIPNIDAYYCFSKFASSLQFVEFLDNTNDYYIWFTRSY